MVPAKWKPPVAAASAAPRRAASRRLPPGEASCGGGGGTLGSKRVHRGRQLLPARGERGGSCSIRSHRTFRYLLIAARVVILGADSRRQDQHVLYRQRVVLEALQQNIAPPATVLAASATLGHAAAVRGRCSRFRGTCFSTQFRETETKMPADSMATRRLRHLHHHVAARSADAPSTAAHDDTPVTAAAAAAVMSDKLDAVIVGAGFGGMYATRKL